MATIELPEFDDVGEAVREGRPLRPARGYRVLYAQGDVNFRPITLANPAPLGRQILATAGANQPDSYSLFALLPSGDFEDIRPDEPFDLRARGAERFIGFLTDRDFKLTLNGHQLVWGRPAISGKILHTLAKASPEEAVFLVVPGGGNRLIGLTELVDLAAPGIEHFVTGPKPVMKWEIIVNSRLEIVPAAHVTFAQVVQLAFPGPHGPNIDVCVTFSPRRVQAACGQLGPGGAVEVKRQNHLQCHKNR